MLAVVIEHAEQDAGLPRYMLGAPATGGAANTATGFGQLQSNAATVLRANVVQLDRGWIEPVINQLYRNMVATTDDPNLKADAQVRSFGATAMMKRELNRSRMMEAMNMLMPFTQSGHIKTEGVMYLLREVVTELGLDPKRFNFDESIDEMREAELMAGLQNAGGVSGGVQQGAPMAGQAVAPQPQQQQQQQQ